jgi:hypothetical protein
VRRALYVLAGMSIAVALVHAVYRERECAARGGVLLRGQFDYVCVAAAGVKP